MLTLKFSNGSTQVINLHPTFFIIKKGEPSIHKKCDAIRHDLGAESYQLKIN